MSWARLHRVGAAWLAATAMLLLSLVPVASHALRGGPPSLWAEVCTTQGSEWVDVSGGIAARRGGESSPDQAHVFEHCPYCWVHTTDGGMPPTSIEAAPLSLRFEVPRLFLAAPRTPHVWLAAQPRAPPALF